MSDDQQLKALISGAASGIGQATAVRMAREGIEVLGLDRDSAGLAVTANLIADAKGNFEGIQVDVSRANEVDEQVRALGDLDIVVNAAGIVAYHDLANTSSADLERLFAVNVFGTFSVCRAAAQGLVRRRGSIVNLASAAGLNGRAYLSAYSATKGAVVALTRSLAVELAPEVRVNAVCPSAVETPMAVGISLPENIDRSKLERHPMLSGRRATADEVAAAIAHLASAEAGSTTGIAYLIDGGAAA